jgi:CAI-1 autoinducer synthase
MSPEGLSLAFQGPQRKGLRALEPVLQRIDDWQSDFAIANEIILGKKPRLGAILMSDNDYLSLAVDPRLVSTSLDWLKNSRQDILMSPAYSQYLDEQKQFETDMASYLGAEAVVLCQSGWAANDGLIQCLADSNTPVYVDLFAHASLWQGINSAGAKPRPFRHNDPASLEALVARYGSGIIAVDTIYSTSGDICPLADLVDIAERHDCILVVDESHAVGLRGPRGVGLVAQTGLIDRVHFRTFSLSKSFVGRGGIIAGNERVAYYFRYTARPAVYSSAVTGLEVARFAAALEIIAAADDRRAALQRNQRYLRQGLIDAGCPIADNDAPIVALVGGTPERTLALRDALESADVFGAVFCAPATPRNRSLVRLTVNATIEQAALDRVIDVCADLHRRDIL